jgi:chromosome segregation ATPase
LEGELQKQIALNFELERELKALKAKLVEEGQSNKNSTGGALEQLQVNLKKIKLERDKLELRNEDLEDELFRVKKGLVGAVSNKTGEPEAEINTLRRENEALKKQLEGLSGGGQAHRSTTEAQTAEVNALRNQLESAKGELADLKEHYEKALDELAIASERNKPHANAKLDLISQAIEEPSFSEASDVESELRTEMSVEYVHRSGQGMLEELLDFVTHNLVVFRHRGSARHLT